MRNGLKKKKILLMLNGIKGGRKGVSREREGEVGTEEKRCMMGQGSGPRGDPVGNQPCREK